MVGEDKNDTGNAKKHGFLAAAIFIASYRRIIIT